MKQAFMVAFSNIRKTKGSSIVLLIVLLISAILLQMGFILIFDYEKNFDRQAKLCNAEDMTIALQTRDEQTLSRVKEILLNDERTKQVQTSESLGNHISFKYATGEMSSPMVILPSDVERDLGKFVFIEKLATEADDTVYLPYSFGTGGGYEIGDKFILKVKADTEFTYTVGGFYENTMISSMNGGLVSILLPRQAYDKLSSEVDIQGVLISIKLYDGVSDEKYLGDVWCEIEEVVPNISQQVTYYSLVKSARTLTANICSLIFIGLALLVTVVAIVITIFNITNDIEEKMKNYGTLKAIGYTSKQIIWSIVLQFSIISLISALLGVLLAFAVLPAVNSLLVIQTGINWEYAFSIVPALIVLLSIVGLVMLAIYLASLRLKKLYPIVALRQGISTHNFKHNFVPLQSSKANVNVSLAIKHICNNLKQNIAMVVITAILAFVCVFMSVMFNAFNLNIYDEKGNAPTFLAGEQADVNVYTASENSDEMYTMLNDRAEVERAYFYLYTNVYIGSEGLSAYVAGDCSQMNNQDLCYQGRLPKYDNEISIGGLYAKNNALKIGDEVTLKKGSLKSKFIITGFIQTTNYLGKDCILTANGYKNIISSPLEGQYNILLKSGYDIETFISSLKDDYGDKIISIINIREKTSSSFSIFTSIVSSIVAVMLVVAIAVIALVLYLMIKTTLIRKKRDYGILKALGFTSKQLMLQTTIVFLPAILLGALLGGVLGVFTINPMLSILFSSIGLVKTMFEIPALLTIGFISLLVVCAVVIAFVMSFKTRNISPRELMSAE